jgi:two-component system cell cycle response regulator
MQGPARVLIVGKDASNDKKLAETLTKDGFECAIGDIAQSAAELCGPRRPDIVVLNMQSAPARKAPETFLALAKALKTSALSSRLRIMLVGTDKNLELNSSAADIDDLLIGPVNPAQICHRLRSLVRLNTMHEELVRRLNTSAKYGLDAPPAIVPPSSVENATVMVLGDPTQFVMIEHSLARQATLVGALSEATALDYLTRRDFDAVIINAATTIEPYVSFVKSVRRVSRLYNLPILMLADRGELAACENIYEAGVTDSIAKPYSCDELKLRVNLLVRESRFRESLKKIYSQAKHYATSDALTGLYSRGFLLEHVSSMVTDANRTSQSFSLAKLSIGNIEAINSELGYAAGDRIIRQVGEVIGLLIRGEDLAARYSGAKFIVALPDTPVEQAKYAIQRINGVIAHTEFVVDGHYAPVKVTLNTTLSGFQQGDTAESLVERTHKVDLRVAA